MGRGLIFGVLWGALFAALGLAGVSQMLPQPAPESDLQPAAAETPAAEPAPTDIVEAPAEASPLLGNEVAEVAPMAAPAETEVAPPVAEAAPEPVVVESTAAVAPSAAQPEAAPVVSTEIAAPIEAPKPVQEEMVAEPVPAPEPEPAPVSAPEPEPAPVITAEAAPMPAPEPAGEPVAVAEAAAPAIEAAPVVAPEPAPAEAAAPESVEAPKPKAQPMALAEVVKRLAEAKAREAEEAAAQAAAAEPMAEPAPAEPAPVVVAEAAPEPQPEPAPEPAPAVEPVTEAPKAPEPGFGAVASVRVNRLPTISNDAPEAAEEPAPVVEAAEASTLPKPGVLGVRVNKLPSIGLPETEAAAVVDVDPASLPPVQRNAMIFDNPEGKPVVSIVIIDIGSGLGGVDPSVLQALPYPVTVALDPTQSGATDAAESYRAAGFEVLILATGVPAGARPSDLEVSFQSHFAAIPQAVGVIDLPEAVLQNDRRLAKQLVTLVGAEGMGLVTYDKGLNSADQLAAEAGVPHSEAFKMLDAENEDAAAIRRTLDRAAFEAGRLGHVMLVGYSQPATIDALSAWFSASGASMAFAPATAVLQGPGR